MEPMVTISVSDYNKLVNAATGEGVDFIGILRDIISVYHKEIHLRREEDNPYREWNMYTIPTVEERCNSFIKILEERKGNLSEAIKIWKETNNPNEQQEH